MRGNNWKPPEFGTGHRRWSTKSWTISSAWEIALRFMWVTNATSLRRCHAGCALHRGLEHYSAQRQSPRRLMNCRASTVATSSGASVSRTTMTWPRCIWPEFARSPLMSGSNHSDTCDTPLAEKDAYFGATEFCCRSSGSYSRLRWSMRACPLGDDAEVRVVTGEPGHVLRPALCRALRGPLVRPDIGWRVVRLPAWVRRFALASNHHVGERRGAPRPGPL